MSFILLLILFEAFNYYGHRDRDVKDLATGAISNHPVSFRYNSNDTFSVENNHYVVLPPQEHFTILGGIR